MVLGPRDSVERCAVHASHIERYSLFPQLKACVVSRRPKLWLPRNLSENQTNVSLGSYRRRPSPDISA